MTNSDRKLCSGLEIESCCLPDPVANAANHETTVTNQGADRYTVDLTVRIVAGTRPGASLALHDGNRQVDVISLFAGTFGPGRGGSWTFDVQRRPGGTSRAHSIRTIAEFTSDAESDPLDDEPGGPSYRCLITVDVGVI
jgi:hypothetical protein